ncbi:MAG: UvrB/UvrC motif-containing protein [Clostridia bacterium]
MLCQNCGKNEVNFRYTQIVNGVKKEMALCDKCAKALGLENLDFNMPINFSSFLGDFLDVAEDTDFLPSFTKTSVLKCNNCGMTYNEFVDKGKLGCAECYNIFSRALNPVLKNIHGSTSHIGRNAKLTPKNKVNNTKKTATNKKETTKLEKLELELKQAVKEERYEDAAKIRDEIKKMSL